MSASDRIKASVEEVSVVHGERGKLEAIMDQDNERKMAFKGFQSKSI
jgi:hypothetical protein